MRWLYDPAELKNVRLQHAGVIDVAVILLLPHKSSLGRDLTIPLLGTADPQYVIAADIVKRYLGPSAW